ncbi:Gluconate 2-dehydrogenase subunit 3 [Chitinophaga costaii]|uniref:Gluconate 2-dehydrogenase subunit 3 n=1 Tax=Chitinophaga costaii TaxID=1335309 RepID=A0A1C4D1A7_9BACT|nr:gluconate 2-dehydrogenase subunit 3 family protein [Chitinophaga costaii]SCC25030.1 Gluconate 2-dehydrogenase subunit 3 [Chitinophaga costaii]
MNVSRRAALKQFVIIAAGAALLPSCLSHSKKKIAGYEKVPIDEDQLALMSGIAQVIVPDNATPGAKAVQADKYALTMLNDCYKQEDRERFLKGMQQFTDQVQAQYKKSFTACTPQEQTAIITAANNTKDAATNDAAYFYHTMKYLTLQAYTGSQYFLTKVQVYQQIPGKYIPSQAV